MYVQAGDIRIYDMAIMVLKLLKVFSPSFTLKVSRRAQFN